MVRTAVGLAVLVGLTVLGGLRLTAQYAEMVARTGQGTNGPLGGMLVSFLGCVLLAGLTGTVVGGRAGARADGVARGLALASVGALAPAATTLVAALVAVLAWPILVTSPNAGMSAPWGFAVISFGCALVGALLGWGVASLVRLARRPR